MKSITFLRYEYELLAIHQTVRVQVKTFEGQSDPTQFIDWIKVIILVTNQRR